MGDSKPRLSGHIAYRAVLKRTEVPEQLWSDDVVLCDREPVKTWSDRRVTLLGDAAHPVPQYLAQGAGQAIEDAVVLREAMRHTHGDAPAAFEHYQQARYLRAGRVQLKARLYGDIYPASDVQRVLRNQMLQSGLESAGFAGLKWMCDGIEPASLFN